MNDNDLRIMQLHGAGYCCAQIILILCLDHMDRENPDLVRAAQGLCLGFGDCSGPCGIMSGGICALGIYAGKGTDTEQADDKLPLLIESFRDWFQSRTETEFGGNSCEQILGEKSTMPNPQRCGGLLTEAYEQIVSILLENGFDPSEGRDCADEY